MEVMAAIIQSPCKWLVINSALFHITNCFVLFVEIVTFVHDHICYPKLQ